MFYYSKEKPQSKERLGSEEGDTWHGTYYMWTAMHFTHPWNNSGGRNCVENQLRSVVPRKIGMALC